MGKCVPCVCEDVGLIPIQVELGVMTCSSRGVVTVGSRGSLASQPSLLGEL